MHNNAQQIPQKSRKQISSSTAPSATWPPRSTPTRTGADNQNRGTRTYGWH